MNKPFAAALLAMLLSACQTAATKPNVLAPGEFDAPIRAGETRLSIRNLDRDKWAAKGADTIGASRTVFVCRPLACASPSVVIYSRIASPTRKPDPQALQVLGRQLLDQAVAKGATERVAPKVGTVKGFPSVSFAYSRDVNGKTEFGRNTAVFSGSLAFNMLSLSQDEAVASRNLDQFLSVIEIRDGGSRHAKNR